MYHYSLDKMYSYNKGWCMARGYKQAVKAMAFARKCHDGQIRKNGEPYIIHPLTMMSHAISLGVASDALLASLALHDVVEDCDVEVGNLPVSSEVREVIRLVTYHKPNNPDNKEMAQTCYYNSIEENQTACLVKLFDRCHNVSTMAGTFTAAKIDEYINETEKFILPLLRHTKDKWPELNDELFVLKYHIDSVISSLKAMRDMQK